MYLKQGRIESCIELIDDVLSVLTGTTSKGFLTSHDLTNYPIVSDLLPSFLSVAGEEYVSGGKSMDSYKWIFNLNLYCLCIETLNSQGTTEQQEGSVEDLKAKELELYSLLDLSIRYHLQKRGISVKENIYVGFDTEFSNKDLVSNKLISAQLAVTTKLYVKIPLNTLYYLSSIDEKSNKLVRQILGLKKVYRV